MRWIYMVVIVVCGCNTEATCCPEECNCTNPMVVDCFEVGLQSMPTRISQHVIKFIADNNDIEKLTNDMLVNAQSLLQLSLSRNRIESLRMTYFENTDFLTDLDLSFNNIRKVRAKTFIGLKRLRTLNLEGNAITNLPPKAFESVESLRHLNLRNNKLDSLSHKLLEKQPSLEILQLANNRITSLGSDVLKSQSSLRILDLSYNRIQKISPNAFRKLYLLQELRLRNNHLRDVDRGWTEKLKRCSNKLKPSTLLTSKVVRDGLFTAMTELSLLDLRNNNLTTISYRSFQNISNMTSLLLEGNSWRCDCALRAGLQSFPVVMQRRFWDRVACRQPPNVQGSTVLDALLVKDTSHSSFSTQVSATDVSVRSEGEALQFLEALQKSLQSPYWSADPVGIRMTSTTVNSIETTRATTSLKGEVMSSTGRKLDSTIRATVSNDAISSVTTESIRTRIMKNFSPRTKNRNTTDTGKADRPDRWWIVAAISAGIFIVICLAVFGINKLLNGQKTEPTSRKGSGTEEKPFRRKSSSNSRFYDYQFSQRPLPRAPSTSGKPSSRNTPEEVRWTDGGSCRLTNHRSSFISLRTYSDVTNVKPNNRANLLSGQRGNFETRDLKATNTDPSRCKLTPLPCKDIEIKRSRSEKPFSDMRRTGTNRNIPPSSDNHAHTVTKVPELYPFTSVIQSETDPPPPPRRNESSKSRCRQLIEKKKLLETQRQSEYCEITDKESNQSGNLRGDLLYKKYLQRVIGPEAYTKQHLASPGLQSTPALEHGEHYDMLSYNTPERRNEGTSRHGSCFNRANQDFVFTRPTEEEKLRRSSTGRLFALRKQREDQANAKGNKAAVKSPLGDIQVYNRAQSFSYAPRDVATSHNQTPTIAICSVEDTNDPLVDPHEYHHLHLTHSEKPDVKCDPDCNSSNRRLDQIKQTHPLDPICDTVSDNSISQNKRYSYLSEHTQASDKEEVEELRSLVQSILRSEHGDSNPVSRSNSTKIQVTDSENHSGADDQPFTLRWPHSDNQSTWINKSFLNVASEVDMTESDDAGYLSPLSTLRNRNKEKAQEEEDIFGEFQIRNHESTDTRSKRLSSRTRRGTKSSSSKISDAENDYRDCYASSESDERYDSIPRVPRKPQRRRQKSTNDDESTIYMSIIDTDDTPIEDDCKKKRKTSKTNTKNPGSDRPEAAFHTREREVYINARISDEENCYEEIMSRQNSIDDQLQTRVKQPSKSKRVPRENYYQEVTKVRPDKKPRRNKSKFFSSLDRSKNCRRSHKV